MNTGYILLATAVVAGGAGLFVANTENEKIKKLIGKGKKTEPIKAVPVKTNTGSGSYSSSNTGYNTANGISSRSPKSDISRLQNALISAGHLAPTQRTRAGKTVSSADGIWGNDTNIAVSKAGLSVPVSELQLNSLTRNSGSSSSSATQIQSNADITKYIADELKSVWSIDYSTIHDTLKPLKKSDIKEIDTIYRREYNEKGLKQMFQSTDKGGKVSVSTFSSRAILELFADAGLSGLGELAEVRTRHNCTVVDEKKGHIVVGKNLILGTVLKSNSEKTLIQTIDGKQVLANTDDLVNHN